MSIEETKKMLLKLDSIRADVEKIAENNR